MRKHPGKELFSRALSEVDPVFFSLPDLFLFICSVQEAPGGSGPCPPLPAPSSLSPSLTLG